MSKQILEHGSGNSPSPGTSQTEPRAGTPRTTDTSGGSPDVIAPKAGLAVGADDTSGGDPDVIGPKAGMSALQPPTAPAAGKRES